MNVKSQETKDLNLYQKLVQVRREVKYVQKGSKGYNFQYASESQILGAIRGKMDELNVFLECDMISLEPVECTCIQNKVVSTIHGLKAVFEFIWTNADSPDQQIKKRVILQDAESTIETVGGLMTYANRYFLYKFFSVPTDKEDPDAFENKNKRFFESSFNPNECEKVDSVVGSSLNFKDILELEALMRDAITPYDSGYKDRALSALGASSFSALTVEQADKLRKNMLKKIEEIAYRHAAS